MVATLAGYIFPANARYDAIMPELALKIPLLPLANMREARALRVAFAALLSLALHLGIWQSVRVTPPAQPSRAAIEARLVPQARTESLFTLPADGEPLAQALPPIEEPPARMPTTSLLDAIAPPGSEPGPIDAAPADPAGSRLPEIGLAATESIYYKAGEVDQGAQFLNPILPEYPAEAHVRGLTGTVDLILFIDEAGQIRDITVERAEPPGFFEEAAIKAFRMARFTPAIKEGRAVRSRKTIRVSFDLTEEP